jgi:hypothetical protein
MGGMRIQQSEEQDITRIKYLHYHTMLTVENSLETLLLQIVSELSDRGYWRRPVVKALHYLARDINNEIIATVTLDETEAYIMWHMHPLRQLPSI